MEVVEQLAVSTDPLLSCCMCQHLLREAVQLKCLHNCCQQCFSTAALTSCSRDVSCGACGAVTQSGSEQRNGFIDGQVQHYISIAESRVCGVCQSNGEHNKPAVVWCSTCRHSLCGDCITTHKQHFRRHMTNSLEEMRSLDEFCSEISASACAVHKKPLDIACLSCEQVKCISCWAECNEKKHESHVVGQKSFYNYLDTFVVSIASVESELLRISEVLDKPKVLLRATKAARDRHLEEISVRKRRILDAVEMAYQEIEFATKNAYDDLEAEGDAAVTTADRIAAALSDARKYIRRLIESKEKYEVLNQQKIVRERLNFLSNEVDSLCNRLSSSERVVKIQEPLPDDVENVVRAWIGVPQVYSASSPPTQKLVKQQRLQQCFSCSAASASLQLTVDCEDVALTHDGRSLLLAAREHGLIELSCDSGRELSRWRPPKHISSGGNVVYDVLDQDDWVHAVAALSDGRAAVSLLCARLVVLLRRSEKGDSSCSGGAAAVAVAGSDAWTEDCRLVDQLVWGPLWLSAHGDVLAACEWYGQRLQLLSLSSGLLLCDSELVREYSIGSLAVTALLVVTGSLHKVKLYGGRSAYVLDAYSFDADVAYTERMWRHELSSSDEEEEDEHLWGICADSSGDYLYAAVCGSTLSSGRVSELSLADGSELRHVTVSFNSATAAPLMRLLLPRRLSLCDVGAAADFCFVKQKYQEEEKEEEKEEEEKEQNEEKEEEEKEQQQSSSDRRLLLAGLCWDPTTRQQRTVTLYRSTSDVL